MSFLPYIELILSKLLTRCRAYDNKLFTRSQPSVTSAPQNITVTSPSCGPTDSHMGLEYTQFGADKFPTLTWSLDDKALESQVAEWLLIVQDPDAPIPIAPVHGIYYAIPAERREVSAEDFEPREGPKDGSRVLNGGFRFGKNIRGTVYGGPRPMLGHGPHRYFYEVVALKSGGGSGEGRGWGKGAWQGGVGEGG